MIHYASYQTSPQTLMHSLPKVSGELRSSIRYDGLGNTMQLDNLSQIQINIFRRSITSLNINEMSRLGQSIYDYPNRVIPLSCSRQTCNEVHTDLFPLLLWNRQRLQQPCGFHVYSFDSATHVTMGHICGYLFLHFGPPEVRPQVLIHLTTARMDRKL